MLVTLTTGSKNVPSGRTRRAFNKVKELKNRGHYFALKLYLTTRPTVTCYFGVLNSIDLFSCRLIWHPRLYGTVWVHIRTGVYVLLISIIYYGYRFRVIFFKWFTVKLDLFYSIKTTRYYCSVRNPICVWNVKLKFKNKYILCHNFDIINIYTEN